MAMPGRTYASTIGGYRYAHNGQEKDGEIFDGALSAEFWEYDSRLGRRWEVDPIRQEWESSYACFGNNPIYYSDIKGLKKGDPKGGFSTGKRQHRKGRFKEWLKKWKTLGKDKGKDKGNPEKKPTDKKPTEKQKEKKQGPTVYIYRVKKATENSYKFENDKDLSDRHLKKIVAPEIARILNNNLLNTPINVKVITEEEAKLITSDFLVKNKSAIMPIVNGRYWNNPGSSLGQSAIGKGSGITSVNPDETYMNFPGIKKHSQTVLGVSSDYGLAWAIAHEVIHQFYSMAQINFDPKLDHTNGWPNLNRDGYEVGPIDFKSKPPIKTLKNGAEWIPIKIRQTIENWFNTNPITP